MNLEELADKARESLLFTAPILGPHLQKFLSEHGPVIRDMAKRVVAEKIEHIYWVGAGNSWVNLYSGKYLLDTYSDLTSDVFTSYEFIWRNSPRLNKKTWVFLASFSGATEDTLAALRHANNRGAHTVAIVNQSSCLMAREAHEVVAYNSKALFILPLAMAYLFSLEVARIRGAQDVPEIIDGLYKLPALLTRQYITEEAPSRQRAEEFQHEKLFYTLGSGPLYGLAYKFGLTVFMENMRVNGSFIETTEFRHGPAEMFDRETPAVVLLIGTDDSRGVAERVRHLCQTQGAHLLVYDLKDYATIHPQLAPFALMIPLQWFAVWSSLLRGVTDMDARILMGRGILGQGSGVTWP